MFSFNCISDQLNRLKEYEKDYDNLAEAEQFAISISGIKRLVPRLKSLMFKQRYKELVQASLLFFTPVVVFRLKVIYLRNQMLCIQQGPNHLYHDKGR